MLSVWWYPRLIFMRLHTLTLRLQHLQNCGPDQWGFYVEGSRRALSHCSREAPVGDPHTILRAREWRVTTLDTSFPCALSRSLFFLSRRTYLQYFQHSSSFDLVVSENSLWYHRIKGKIRLKSTEGFVCKVIRYSLRYKGLCAWPWFTAASMSHSSVSLWTISCFGI